MSEEKQGIEISKDKKYMLQFPAGTSTKAQTEYLDKVSKAFEKDNIVTIDASIKIHYVPVAEKPKPSKVEIGADADVEPMKAPAPADEDTKAAVKAVEEAAKKVEEPKKDEDKKPEEVATEPKKTETETPTKKEGEEVDSTITEGNTTVEKVVSTPTPSGNPDDNVAIPATSESSDDKK